MRKKENPPEGMTRSAYARHRGVSAAMVSKLGKAGRLVLLPNGSVDVQRTDALLKNVLDKSRGGPGGRPARRQTVPSQYPAAAESAPPVPSFDLHRTRRENFNAERA